MFGANAELTWFLLGLGLIVSELVLPGFVMIFFGVGAWVTAACIWLGIADSFDVQLIIFLASSILSLILFRKQGKEYFRGKVSGMVSDVSELDDVKGERGIVMEDVVPNSLSGRVEFRGTIWNADADTTIRKGTPVEILGRSDLTLKVQPLQERVSS